MLNSFALRRGIIFLYSLLLVGGLLQGFLGEARQVTGHFICVFKSHTGKGAGPNLPFDRPAPLGFIEVLTASADHKARITGGAMEVLSKEGKVTFQQVYIKGEPLKIGEDLTGEIVVTLVEPAQGTFEAARGHEAIQADMELRFILTGVPAEGTFPAKFIGQMEMDPVSGHLAFNGDIQMTKAIQLPVFGDVFLVDLRIWCVQQEQPEPVKNFLKKLLPPPKVDVFFLVDLSASMSEEVPAFKVSVHEILSDLQRTNLDFAFGLGTFTTYPGFAGFWPDPNNFPYGLPPGVPGGRAFGPKDTERILDPGPADTLIAAVESPDFTFLNFGDQPETQLTALCEAALGSGQAEWVSPGGAVRWREGSLRLIVLMTDQPFTVSGQTRGKNTGLPTFPGPCVTMAPDPPPFFTTVQALTHQRIEVIGVFGDPNPAEMELLLSDLRAIAEGTGTLAPATGVDCDGDGVIDIKPNDPIVCPLDRLVSNLVPAVVNSVKAKIKRDGLATRPIPVQLVPLDDPGTPFDEREIVKEICGPKVQDGTVIFTIIKQCTVPLLAEAQFNPEGIVTLQFQVLDTAGQVMQEEELIVPFKELGCVTDP